MMQAAGAAAIESEIHGLPPPEKNPKMIGDSEEEEESEKLSMLRDTVPWDDWELEYVELSGYKPGQPNYTTDDDDYVPTSDADQTLYHLQLQQTQGYDISYFPGTHPFWVQPVPNPDNNKSYLQFCMKAAHVYNKNNQAQINFLKLVKVNSSFGPCAPRYITFEARDGADGEVKTYQTRVGDDPDGGPCIEEVREKPYAN